MEFLRLDGKVEADFLASTYIGCIEKIVLFKLNIDLLVSYVD